jgi:hypothetical protein
MQNVRCLGNNAAVFPWLLLRLKYRELIWEACCGIPFMKTSICKNRKCETVFEINFAKTTIFSVHPLKFVEKKYAEVDGAFYRQLQNGKSRNTQIKVAHDLHL